MNDITGMSYLSRNSSGGEALLTKEEEKVLGERIAAANYAASLLQQLVAAPLPQRGGNRHVNLLRHAARVALLVELVRLVADGQNATNVLIERNLRLVFHWALRITNCLEQKTT